ncbi:MAG: hypothetical protein J0L78_16725 [Planctomycetes bacterium]|nr:hypothetical protein [Planctomycetota bacterium]
MFETSAAAANYPFPLVSAISNLSKLMPEDFGQRFVQQDSDRDFELEEIIAKLLIEWFADCWTQAGGSFLHRAVIAIHDAPEMFDLVAGGWLPVDGVAE